MANAEDYEKTVKDSCKRLETLVAQFEKEMVTLSPYKRHVEDNLKTFTEDEIQRHKELIDRVSNRLYNVEFYNIIYGSLR